MTALLFTLIISASATNDYGLTHTPMSIYHEHATNKPTDGLQCSQQAPPWPVLMCEQNNVEVSVDGAVPDEWGCTNIPAHPKVYAQKFILEVTLPKDILFRIAYSAMAAILRCPYASYALLIMFALFFMGLGQLTWLLIEALLTIVSLCVSLWSRVIRKAVSVPQEESWE